jgi:amino acid transporter
MQGCFLTGFQADFRKSRRARPGALPMAALLCLFLLALLAVVQVAHMHPLDSDSDHCPLCIAMHTAAPVAVFAAVVVLVQIEANAPAFEPRTVVRNWHPKFITRPPPAGC